MFSFTFSFNWCQSFNRQLTNIVSSVRSSSGYHGLIEIRSKATFSNFSNSSDSKVKVKVKGPNMCYIFEKHWIQGYRICDIPVCQIHYIYITFTGNLQDIY